MNTQRDENWPKWPTYPYATVPHCFRCIYPHINLKHFKALHGYDTDLPVDCRDMSYKDKPEYQNARVVFFNSRDEVDKARERIKNQCPEAYAFYTTKRDVLNQESDTTINQFAAMSLKNKREEGA